MNKLISSGRELDVKQVSVCTSLLAVIGRHEAGKCMYKLFSSGREHDVKQVRACTRF